MCQSDKEKYILLSKLNTYKKKVEKALETSRTALQESKNPSLSFSGGKDSVVLLDIAVKAGFNGKLVFFKYGICNDVETPKENIDILKYYAEKKGLRYDILECLGEVDCWEQCGRFILVPETKEEKTIFNKTNYDYAKKYAEYEKENGIDLGIIGMRKAESKNRRIVLSMKGPIYKTKTRESITCCPLLNFSNADIWAYIFSNDLKYLSIYDYKYIDRERNRNEITMLYNDGIIRNGAIFHYINMYPDFFSWLRQRWGVNF